MGIREFLKPAIWKIISSLILLIIPAYKRILCPFVPPCITEWYSITSLSLEILKNQIYNGIIFILISIVIVYLISCLIVFIYNKIRGKRKK